MEKVMENQVVDQLVKRLACLNPSRHSLPTPDKWLPFVLLGLLTGCTASIHPLLTEADLVEQEDLSGRWELEIVGSNQGNEKEHLLLEFEKYDTSTYDVFLRSAANKENSQLPEAWTLQVGVIKGQRFAQVIPRDLPVGPPLAKGIPVYVFGRVEFGTNEIKFYGLLDTRCAALADQAKLQHMTYEPSDMVELTVFTMPTEELQKIVIEHGDKMFKAKPVILRRVGADRK
ncbi:hypothetical protein N9D23_01080 [Rubripirellula sp.]|nr:hypothetical protein [Rubripirellula sp.]